MLHGTGPRELCPSFLSKQPILGRPSMGLPGAGAWRGASSPVPGRTWRSRFAVGVDAATHGLRPSPRNRFWRSTVAAGAGLVPLFAVRPSQPLPSGPPRKNGTRRPIAGAADVRAPDRGAAPVLETRPDQRLLTLWSDPRNRRRVGCL